MFKFVYRVVLLVTLVFFMTSIALAQDNDSIVDIINVGGFYPEGIAYHAESGNMLLSSLMFGTIYSVDPTQGNIRPFIEDESLIASAGLYIAENMLYVINFNPAIFSPAPPDGFQSGVLVFDLATGEKVLEVDLTGLVDVPAQFSNDITVDNDGNMYVTDSFNPVIYKIDPQGNASVWVENDLLMNETFGLNGIVYHPDGFIVAAITGSGQLYRLRIDDPENLVEISISESLFGADGLLFQPNGMLVVVGNSSETIFVLASEDDWFAAEIITTETTPRHATTATQFGDQVAILYSDPNAFFAGEHETVEIAVFNFEQ